MAVSTSPNGFALTSLSLNGHISSSFTSETSGYDLDVDVLVRHAVVALLNEWDYSDIVSIVVKAARVSNDHRKDHAITFEKLVDIVGKSDV